MSAIDIKGVMRRGKKWMHFDSDSLCASVCCQLLSLCTDFPNYELLLYKPSEGGNNHFTLSESKWALHSPGSPAGEKASLWQWRDCPAWADWIHCEMKMIFLWTLVAKLCLNAIASELLLLLVCQKEWYAVEYKLRKLNLWVCLVCDIMTSGSFEYVIFDHYTYAYHNMLILGVKVQSGLWTKWEFNLYHAWCAFLSV